MVSIERGAYGGVPYAAVGSGPPLVVLPGISPAAGVDSDQLVKGAVAPLKRLARHRRLVVLNRWPALPSDLTMTDLARGHADAIREGFGGEPVDVFGMSTGGSIAQQLAAHHPDVVRRLGLMSTGCRLGPVGRADQAEVARLLTQGDVRAAAASAVGGLVPRPLARVGAAAGWLGGRRVLGSARDHADLVATLVAEDAFDLATCAGVVEAPTLLVVGGRDRFYGRDLFEETQRLIPDSRLLVRDRRGHVTVTFDGRALAALATFFDG